MKQPNEQYNQSKIPTSSRSTVICAINCLWFISTCFLLAMYKCVNIIQIEIMSVSACLKFYKNHLLKIKTIIRINIYVHLTTKTDREKKIHTNIMSFYIILYRVLIVFMMLYVYWQAKNQL